MYETLRTLLTPSLAAILSLCSAASAWAGDGGASLPVAQHALDNTCASVGISAANCPQLPTINQIVVEISALLGTAPDESRHIAEVPLGHAVDGGSQGGVSTPLAFISPANKGSPPVPTQPNDPAANSFISATVGPASSPTTLNLAFSYLPRTNSTFTAGQDVGDITLPFIEADQFGNDLGSVSGTLHITGTGGTAVDAQVDTDLLGLGSPQTYSLTDLGMTLSLDFSSGHEVIDLAAPLLIPLDLQSAYNFTAPGFEFDAADMIFEGIDPVATFLSANFVNDANDPPAINADLAIGIAGGTVLSTPLPAPEPTTIALLGSGLLGLAMLRRRRGAPAD
jgi:PEP-CTERM motif